MQEDVQEIDTGLVFPGYGAPKVGSRTVASVATVQGKEIARTPDANAMDALARHVANMIVTTRRSEEHTSELQSHDDLVCRLLLEKKK